MRLGDMTYSLRIPCLIEIRDKDNTKICTCGTDSKGIDPYVNYEVVEWFPNIFGETDYNCLTVLIDLEDTDDVQEFIENENQ